MSHEIGKRVSASAVELTRIARRMHEANDAAAAAKEAKDVALDVWSMFCEGHGISGATFVGIEDGQVIVSLPDAPKPAAAA